MKTLYQNITIALIFMLTAILWFYSDKTIELYGDIFRLMILPIAGIWLLQKQYTKLKELIFVSLCVLGIAFAIKLSIAYFASYDSLQYFLEFAKRPINGEFKGFPSGHTTAVFIVVFFVWKYGSIKWRIVVTLLASLVALSRVISMWHTPTQVIAGAILGFVGSLLILKIIHRFYPTRPSL